MKATTLALATFLMLSWPRPAGAAVWVQESAYSAPAVEPSAPSAVSSAPNAHSSSVPAADSSAPFVPGNPFAPGPPYRIGLGDVLRISVWKEPEFSATLQVRSDGKISLPLLNDVDAVGSTPTALAAFLADKLKKYVDDPRVTVIVSQAKAPTIYMVGEVGRHGPMALTPNMTVLEALVTAGPTIYANTKKIYVLRIENGVERKLPVNYKQLVKGREMNRNLVLQAGDMVVVP